jgi:hypothetical protein
MWPRVCPGVWGMPGFPVVQPRLRTMASHGITLLRDVPLPVSGNVSARMRRIGTRPMREERW